MRIFVIGTDAQEQVNIISRENITKGDYYNLVTGLVLGNISFFLSASLQFHESQDFMISSTLSFMSFETVITHVRGMTN